MTLIYTRRQNSSLITPASAFFAKKADANGQYVITGVTGVRVVNPVGERAGMNLDLEVTFSNTVGNVDTAYVRDVWEYKLLGDAA